MSAKPHISPRNQKLEQDVVLVFEKFIVFYAVQTCEQTIKTQSGAYIWSLSALWGG